MSDVPENENTQELDFEPEDEFGDVGAAKAKMKKLRDELAAVKKERAEYLDGWQRAKADMINARKEAAESYKKAAAYATEEVVSDIIPALDSFDLAMQGSAWQSVDAAWRKGVESIRDQLLSALEKNGITAFGKDEERFDHALHDAVEEIPSGGVSQTIAKVFRRGYRTKDRVIRPAQVAVYA